jgi:D-glycero-beta-D-manno-heptose-7-phosphate kinase
MSPAEVQLLFNQFRKNRVIVIGDVMVDSYMWGQVNRISPEAPVPVVSVTRKENRPGGAANVALNLLSMGAKPIICGVVGSDHMGRVFMDLLYQHKITEEGMVISKRRPTTVKTRIISQGQHLLRVDEEVNYTLHEEIEHKFIEKVLDLIANGKPDAIIFQDYDKGVITPVLIEEVIGLARIHNIPVLVDPKKRNFHFYKNVQLFKPNFRELSEGMNLDLTRDDKSALFEAVKKLMRKNQIEKVMVTLSDKGIFIADQKNYISLPAEVRQIADVSGAGDTVISVAALALIHNLTMEETAVITNLAGGQVCESAGVVPVDYKKLLAACLEAFV